MWSTPRDGYPGNPKNPKYKKKTTTEQKEAKTEEFPGQIVATFRNDGVDPALENAKLYFHDGNTDSLWGNLGHNDPPLSINTYKGHVWKLKVGEEVKKIWTIDTDQPPTLEFAC